MESASALTATKRRRLMDLGRVVPEILLDVGTMDKVFTSIKDARDLLGEDYWGYDEADYLAPLPSFGDVPLNTTCGFQDVILYQYDDTPPAPDFAADLWYDNAAAGPGFLAESHRYSDAVHAPDSWADHLCDEEMLAPDSSSDFWYDDEAPAHDYSSDFRYDEEAPAPDYAPNLQYDDEAPGPDNSPDVQYDDAASDSVYLTDLLAMALARDGLPEVYREITHLVALHGEAGRVLYVCATRLGIQSGGGHTLGAQPDGDATWKRWRDLRASVVRHAHDALLRLRAAASAVTAANELIRWHCLECPGRNEWLSTGRRLVGDARRSLDEVKDSVRLMRDAVVHEYFETWMILNRA